jgi:hypothetical protein
MRTAKPFLQIRFAGLALDLIKRADLCPLGEGTLEGPAKVMRGLDPRIHNEMPREKIYKSIPTGASSWIAELSPAMTAQ